MKPKTNTVIFDLGGTLMEFEGMPSCWTDYYVQGFKYVNEVMGRSGQSPVLIPDISESITME